jgi:hypothetical protein
MSSIDFLPDDFDDDTDWQSMFGPFDNNENNDNTMPQKQTTTISDETFPREPMKTITIDDVDISSILNPTNNNPTTNQLTQ